MISRDSKPLINWRHVVVLRRPLVILESEQATTGEKQRNRALKHVFCQSAFCSLKDPISRAYYDRKKKEGKTGQQVLIALARRRANVLFAMVRDGLEYVPQASVERHKIDVFVARQTHRNSLLQ